MDRAAATVCCCRESSAAQGASMTALQLRLAESERRTSQVRLELEQVGSLFVVTQPAQTLLITIDVSIVTEVHMKRHTNLPTLVVPPHATAALGKVACMC